MKRWANLSIFIIINVVFVVLYRAMREYWNVDWAFTCGYISCSIYYSLKYK